MFHRSGSTAPSATDPLPPPPPPTLIRRRGTLPCSDPDCSSMEAVQCSYVDRRQRACDSAWCRMHQQMAFGTIYCRRHAGIIRALGADWMNFALPDLDNRAPSLANWVGSDLNDPIRNLLERFFGVRKLNVSSVVNGGTPRERSWGRSWKLISENGVDLAVNVSVPEEDDTLVRVLYEGRVLMEMVPPWIEARRRGMDVDDATDAEARRRFYGLILEDLEDAMRATLATREF